MANLITLSRFLLLFVLVAMALKAPPAWQLVDGPLLVLIIALDGVDGYVARRRGETSTFGSVFDVVVDRIVEYVLWIVLAYLNVVAVWVAILFITRGVVVDSVRYTAVSRGETVFGMMRSRWGRFLVASRFMRALYGAAKLVCFGWLFTLQPLPALFPELWRETSVLLAMVSDALVFATAVLCLARGVPVVLEYLWAEGVVSRPKLLRDAR